MPEGGNKHNKRQAGLSDEASAGSPRWKIKSSCVWLIPGDVPGQRSMHIPPPAPRRLLVFKPKAVEAVQNATHQASQSVIDSGSNYSSSNYSSSNNPQLEKTDLVKSDLNSSDINSSDTSHIVSGKGLANEKTATGADSSEGSHTGLSDTSEQTLNSATRFDHKADSPTNTVTQSGHAQEVNQQPELEGPDASTMQNTLNQLSKFNYRKIIPALLLLLLILLLGSLGKEYFANKSNLATAAVSQVETNNLAQADLTQAALTSVPEQMPVNSDAPGQLPVVDISPSKIGRRPISGLRKLTHIVVKGDTLWDISKAYLQNPFRYPELAKLSHIKNPDLIYPGEIIHIHIKIEE